MHSEQPLKSGSYNNQKLRNFYLLSNQNQALTIFLVRN